MFLNGLLALIGILLLLAWQGAEQECRYYRRKERYWFDQYMRKVMQMREVRHQLNEAGRRSAASADRPAPSYDGPDPCSGAGA